MDSTMRAGEVLTAKLAKARLSQRRSNSSSNRTGSVAAQMSRIQKPASRSNSPKSLDKLKTTAGVSQRPRTDDNNASEATSSQRPSQNVVRRARFGRPSSWAASNADYLPAPPSSFPLATTSSSGNTPSWQNSSYDWQAMRTVQTPLRRTSPQLQFTHPSHILHHTSFSYSEPDLTSFFPAWFDETIEGPAAWATREQLFDNASHGYVQTQHRSSSDIDETSAAYTLPSYFPSPQHYQYPELEIQSSIQWHPTYDTSVTEKDAVAGQNQEELVGLGLYDKAEDVSPRQQHRDHPFVLTMQGMACSRGKGLKLEETWQPPLDPNSIASAEGSEISTSPHDYTQLSSEPAMVQYHNMPDYPIDFGENNVFFEGEDLLAGDWVTQEFKSVHSAGFDAYGWTEGRTGASYF